MSAPAGTKDKNSELMKAMGSKSGRYDPEPPEQWRWDLAHGTPKQRFRAWVKWKTTGHPTFEGRSPFCVSEAGTPLTLEHAAVDLGWSAQYVRKVAAEVEQDGFVRLQKGGKIFNRADVPVSAAPPPEDANEFVQARWSPYLADSIRGLSPEKREVFDAAEAEYLDWRDRGFTEMVAAWRLMVERVENIMFERVGIEKKRLAKTEREAPPVVQLSLLDVPKFVQNGNAQAAIEFVQGAKPHRTKPKKGSHKPESAAASLLPLDEDQESKRPVGRSVVEPAAPNRSTDLIPFPTELKPEDNLHESIERWCSDHLGHLNDPPERALCLQIVANLKGAPLEYLWNYAAPRLKKITSVGILRNFAHKVGLGYSEAMTKRKRAAEAKDAQDAQASEEVRKLAQKTLDDPRAGPDEKKLAHQILGTSSKSAGGES
jgi:hypothetical protein